MSENDFYIPLMLSCGLLRPVPKKKEVVPSINHIRNGFGYTWDDFFIEYNLDMEVSHIFKCDGDNNRQTKHYFVRIGRFSSGRVTILEQLRQEGNNIVIKGIRRAQVQLIRKIAEEEIEPLSWPVSSSVSDHPTAVRTKEEELEATEKAASSYYLDTANENLSTLLKLHFFDRIVKDGKNSKEIWDLIDEKKLRSGVAEFIKAFHSSTYELKKKRQVEASSIVEPTDDDIPLNGKKVSDFPSLSQYGIPLVRSCIQPLMRDIYLLSKSSNATDLLTFPVFNGSVCSVMRIPSSSDYNRFKRNARRTKWVDQLLLLNAGGVEEKVEEGVAWILHYLGEAYSDSFTTVACDLGLLLAPKVMDAESACAMWEEANCPIRAQRIILRHLSLFFGRRIMVPEQTIRELEQGALLPICDSIVLNNTKVYFWYKKINEAILHRLKVEVNARGTPFIRQYDQADIVFGGDHGARRFRAVIKFILRNKDDNTIEPYSVVIHVGNVDCKKDTREVLEKTIGNELNESLKLIVGKVISFCCADPNTPMISLLDEPPADEMNERSFWLKTRTFVAGDLSFFATILGKENMSGTWCTWCMLSKAQWNETEHLPGELWTIEKIYGVRENVTENGMLPTPDNLKGCTDKPLFNAVPICNFVIPVLHIIIGIGNTLVDCIFEWIEERIEKLTPAEIEVRNSFFICKSAI
jgi:hypothetical protein